MSTKNNPGAFRCFEAALPDEPIFTILGRDPAAQATLQFWASQRSALGKNKTPEDRDRIANANRDAEAMRNWRIANADIGPNGESAWRLVKITDEDGGPICLPPENVQYVPAERDGDEAVRLSREWLLQIAADLVNGDKSREDFAALIELACGSPQRRKVGKDPVLGMGYQPDPKAKVAVGLHQVADDLTAFIRARVQAPERHESASLLLSFADRLNGYAAELTGVNSVAISGVDESEDRLRYRIEGAVHGLRDGRLPAPYDLFRAVAAGAGWAYETVGIGLSDLEEMLRRLTPKAPDLYATLAARFGLEPDELRQYDGGHAETKGERVMIDTHPDDLAHAPEVPPHRFSQFHKGERYAYARGLEINPTHLPVALDAMAEDGWHLLSIFGATDSKNVGFIFERKIGFPAFTPPVAIDKVYHPREGGRDSPEFQRYMAGESFEELTRDGPALTPAQAEAPDWMYVIEYAERKALGGCQITRSPVDDWPEWALPCSDRGRGMMP